MLKPVHLAPASRVMTRTEFSALVRDHLGRLTAYARMVTGDPAKADDLVQDSFLVAWQNLGKFDVTRDLACWLRGIVRNKWHESCRRAGREISMDEEMLAAVESAVVGLQADQPEIFDHLATCRGHLPAPLAASVNAYYDESLSSDEAAASLGINAATLRKRLERAREALRQCLKINQKPN